MKKVILFLVLFLSVCSVFAQVNLTNTTTVYTQNFNTLNVRNTSSVVPLGWSILEIGANANTLITANTGASTTGDTYSYGTGTNTERALGMLGSATLNSQIGVSFRNSTGQTLTSITVRYTGEVWRTGAANRQDKIDVQYSTNATSLATGTWIDVNELDFLAPVITTTGAKNGNQTANRRVVQFTLNGLSIPANTIFYFKWKEFDATGAEDGLAIDDLSVSFGAATVDLTPPLVSNLSPTNASSNQPTSGNLSMTFNENIVKGTGNILIKRVSDNSIAATIPVTDASVTISNNVVTIPYSGLIAGTQYWIEIPSGIFRDASSNAYAGMSSSATWSFTTSNVVVSSTFKVVNWNIEWFGGSLGPTDNVLQQNNVLRAMQQMNADVYALGEIVDVARLQALVNALPGYAFIIADFCSASTNATGCRSDQKLAFVYKTSSVTRLNHRGMMRVGGSANASYNWSNGRFPFLMEADVFTNGVTNRVQFITLHAKANTADFITSYNRRRDGAAELRDSLVLRNPTGNWIVLGDYNDDLDRTITTQVAPNTTSSYSSFLNEPSFVNVTLPLSLAGQRSTVNYPDVIDHVTISDEMNRFYVANSSRILRTEMESLIPAYGTTTSDHYPVMTEYLFSQAITNSAVNTGIALDNKKKYKSRVLQTGFELQIFVEGLNDVKTSFALVDLQGRQTSMFNGTPVGGKLKATFNTQQLSKGIYIVNIQNGNRQSTIKVMLR
ncbi:MAG: Ig-like domain-containing protein [Chitinophagaceae bacterium]|jgi:endonuclease/exonuclease/phosphatase family metal-dependent hydrolase